MELGLLFNGFLEIVMNWQSIIGIFIGVSIGLIVGSTPGLTSNMALAIGVPLTFGVPAIISVPFLMGLYKASTYGGSVAAILVNTPGTPAAGATILDGYPLKEQGKSGKALKIALYASLVGDLLSDVAVIIAAMPLANVAMKLGPVEFTTLILFSLTITGALSGKNVWKGVTVTMVGLLLATIGLDPISALPRFTFGNFTLTRGFDFIVVLIGLFTISEALMQIEKLMKKSTEDEKPAQKIKIDLGDKDMNRVTLNDAKRCALPTLVSSFIGVVIGALPGLGGAVASFMGYGAARGMSKHKDEFGKGAVEGVAAPEAANNGVCGANMIPMLSLGIPGNSAAAILGAGLMMQGIRPGPTIFQEHGAALYAIFAGMILANPVIYIVATQYLRLAKMVLRVPGKVLFPVIIMLSIVGSFAINNSMFDVLSVIIFGVLGYVMRKYGFPTTPMVIAFLLEPLFERSFRRSLLISDGSYKVFIQHPVSLVFLIFVVLSVIGIAYGQIRSRRPDRLKKVIS